MKDKNKLLPPYRPLQSCVKPPHLREAVFGLGEGRGTRRRAGAISAAAVEDFRGGKFLKVVGLTLQGMNNNLLRLMDNVETIHDADEIWHPFSGEGASRPF